MDLDTLLKLANDGSGYLVSIAWVAYLIVQNKALSSRNDVLEDKFMSQSIATTEALSQQTRALERLTDKLRG